MKGDRNDATFKNGVNKCDFHTIISNPWSVGLYIYTHITEIDILYSYIYYYIYIYSRRQTLCPPGYYQLPQKNSVTSGTVELIITERAPCLSFRIHIYTIYIIYISFNDVLDKNKKGFKNTFIE